MYIIHIYTYYIYLKYYRETISVSKVLDTKVGL